MQKINLIADSNFLEPLTLKEKEVQNYVLEHWEIIFPHLQLIKDEFELEANTRSHNDSRGRVDILAFNPIKNCLVIIEIKRNFDINIESQANDYKRKINKNFDKIYLEISQILKFDLPAAHKMEKKADLVLLQKDFTQTNLEILEDSDYNQQITLLRYELWKNAENICFVFEYLNNEPKFKQNALAKKAQELPKKPDLFAPPPVLAQKEEVKPAPLVQNEIIAKPAEIIKTDTDQAWWDSLTDNWKRVIKGNLLFKKYGVEEEILEGKDDNFFDTKLNSYLKKWGIIDFSLDLNFAPQKIYDLEVLYAGRGYVAIENNTLEPIKRLNKLKKADFSQNFYNISDLSPLKDLKELVHLNLLFNEISDLSPLKDLKNLEYLSLAFNQISDLSPLKDLKYLEYLSLKYNQISDLSPLKNLKKLKYLYLEGNSFSDLSPHKYKALKNLEYLGSGYNNISNLSPLIHLPSLKYLDFTVNEFMDLRPLLNFPSLQIVRILDSKEFKDTQNKVLADLEKKGVVVNKY